jgi:hypothetical protein
MVDTLTKVGRLLLAPVVAPLIMNAGQVGAEPINKPSPTFPENPQALVIKSNKPTASLPTSSPTNPTPKRDNTDIVNLSKPSPFSVTRMPRDLSQVAQREEQPSNNASREEPNSQPPSPGKDALTVIKDLTREVTNGQQALTDKFRKLPTPPGG